MPLYLLEIRFKADNDSVAKEEAAAALDTARGEFENIFSIHLTDGHKKAIKDSRIDVESDID